MNDSGGDAHEQALQEEWGRRVCEAVGDDPNDDDWWRTPEGIAEHLGGISTSDEFGHEAALQILCRAFDDGADAGMDEWRAFYGDGKGWWWWARALGGFIWGRIQQQRNAAETERDAYKALVQEIYLAVSAKPEDAVAWMRAGRGASLRASVSVPPPEVGK